MSIPTSTGLGQMKESRIVGSHTFVLLSGSEEWCFLKEVSFVWRGNESRLLSDCSYPIMPKLGSRQGTVSSFFMKCRLRSASSTLINASQSHGVLVPRECLTIFAWTCSISSSRSCWRELFLWLIWLNKKLTGQRKKRKKIKWWACRIHAANHVLISTLFSRLDAIFGGTATCWLVYRKLSGPYLIRFINRSENKAPAFTV